jgi:hypothetical protein
MDLSQPPRSALWTVCRHRTVWVIDQWSIRIDHDPDGSVRVNGEAVQPAAQVRAELRARWLHEAQHPPTPTW